MIVIEKNRLIFSLLIMILITGMLLGFGLHLPGGEKWQMKFEFQSFFFWGLIALLLQLLITVSLLLRHKKIMKNIRTLSSFDDFDSTQARRAFKKLGLLGEDIQKVLMKENQVSVMRADRISVLNNLVNVLCEDYSEPIVVTDINGTIFAISDPLKKRMIKENGGGIPQGILEIKSDIQLPEVIGFVEKHRTSWKDSEGAGIVCTPVFDKRGSLHFCLWEFETNFFTGKIKELMQQKPKAAPNLKNPRDWLHRFRQKNGSR